MKNLRFFGGFFFKWKTCWHLEFLMNQIFGQKLIIFKKMRYRVNYCWNYGPSKLLLHFFFFFFLKFTQIHILFLYFFQNERNITTFLLMIHLKCTVVHYANLNSSSKNKPFLNYGSLNMLFRFFRFLIYVYFNETFVKKLMK